MKPMNIKINSNKLPSASGLHESYEHGTIKWKVYKTYFKSYGMFGIVLSMIMLTALTVSLVMTGYWLNWWTEDKFNQGYKFYILIYGCIGVSQGFANILLTFTFLMSAISASNSFHAKMLQHVMKSPMMFFYGNPVGRIINRFSYDLQVCDYVLPNNILTFLSSIAKIVGSMISIIPIIPIVSLIFIPAGFIFYLAQKTYLNTSRQLNRLDAISRSAVFSHVSDTFKGASSIRAYRLQKHFQARFSALVDSNIQCPYGRAMANIWLRIRMDLIANCITFGAALSCVLGSRGGGDVGYVISYCFSFLSNLSWFVKVSADVETNSVAVERIFEYANLPTEDQSIHSYQYHMPAKPSISTENISSGEWPFSGSVKFSKVYAKYSNETQMAVEDVSCDIEAGARVALVGRTGAGKSSLLLVLFRMLETCFGKIEIDGIDTAEISLNTLRKSMSIIPQTPVIFPTTVR